MDKQPAKQKQKTKPTSHNHGAAERTAGRRVQAQEQTRHKDARRRSAFDDDVLAATLSQRAQAEHDVAMLRGQDQHDAEVVEPALLLGAPSMHNSEHPVAVSGGQTGGARKREDSNAP